jgi:hypothetical protein
MCARFLDEHLCRQVRIGCGDVAIDVDHAFGLVVGAFAALQGRRIDEPDFRQERKVTAQRLLAILLGEFLVVVVAIHLLHERVEFVLVCGLGGKLLLEGAFDLFFRSGL